MADTNFLMTNLEQSVPEEIAGELIKNIVTTSTAFQVCRTVEMASETKKLPVLTDTGSAYWTAESEKINTSIMGFDYPVLAAKKLAVIVPITKEKVSDSAIAVLSEIQEGISDAFVRAIDAAVFFGTSSPFLTNVAKAAEANKIENTGALDADISAAMGKVENSDLTVNAIVTSNKMRKSLRELRDANNNALVLPGGSTGNQIYNTPIYIPGSKSWDFAKADLLLGDFTRAVIGTRDNMTFETLREATVGDINLAERDMLAVKCTMRMGFNVIDSKAFSAIVPKAGA